MTTTEKPKRARKRVTKTASTRTTKKKEEAKKEPSGLASMTVTHQLVCYVLKSLGKEATYNEITEKCGLSRISLRRVINSEEPTSLRNLKLVTVKQYPGKDDKTESSPLMIGLTDQGKKLF